MVRPTSLQDPGIEGRRSGHRIGYSYFYVANFFHTPVLSHLFYGALALLFLFLLARRGTAPDIAIAGLQVAALAFAASFFVISIACDYRYLYFLDLSAMTGSLQFVSGHTRARG